MIPVTSGSPRRWSSPAPPHAAAMAVAALEEVEEAAEASSLSGAENVVAGRVREVMPALRQAQKTLGGAFEGG